jgi:hypothetical protein
MALHPRRSYGGVVVAGIALAVTAIATAGCAPSTPTPTPSSTTTSAVTPSPTASAPSVPVLIPDGTAAENLPLFSAVTARVWKGAHRGEGRAYIDALVQAGFDKADMQVTRDTSTVGNPAESIQFSVLWDKTECLVGQVGPATGNPVTTVLPALGDGKCLLGDTRPIDW